MRHIFIVNPISGKNKKATLIADIEELAHQKKLDYEILITQYPKHATELASKYSIKDDVCLYSIGGDGTAYEILNGLKDQVCLSIIPSGTGNDFYRMISDTTATTFKQQLLDAIEGKIVYVDYGINNHTRFLNCTTIGLDAEINYRASSEIRNQYLPGGLTYVVAAVSKIVEAKPVTLTIETENEKWTQSCSLCAIMNGCYYGGGFIPTPSAIINDGYFDLCIVEKLSRAKMMSLLTKYMKGKHTDLAVVKMIKAKKVMITSQEETIMQSDGECFHEKKIHLEIMHKALKLKVPQYSKLQ